MLLERHHTPLLPAHCSHIQFSIYDPTLINLGKITEIHFISQAYQSHGYQLYVSEYLLAIVLMQ